jgi:hypothetical protein
MPFHGIHSAGLRLHFLSMALQLGQVVEGVGVALPGNLGTNRSSLRFRIALGESHLAGNTIFGLRSFAEDTEQQQGPRAVQLL